MARALIVGCGCRGRLLAERLLGEGWSVRGTSRSAEGLASIEAAGIEAARADPGQPGTVLDLVGDATVVAWLLGSARGGDGELAAIHGPRLEAVLERLVETPVRGFVYEAAGSVEASFLERGREAVSTAARTWRIPVETIDADPGKPPRWVEEALAKTRSLVGQPAERYS